MDYPELEEFKRHLNTVFQVRYTEGTSLEFLLVEATLVRRTRVQEVFTLVFKAPPQAPPLTQVYPLEHAELGTLEIFLSPFKREPGALYLEAAFNRLLTK